MEDIPGLLLECSICLDLCEIPVSMCKNGHNVCQSHIEKLLNCPVCRTPYYEGLGLTRNLLAETMLLKMEKMKEDAKKLSFPTNTPNLSRSKSTWNSEINNGNQMTFGTVRAGPFRCPINYEECLHKEIEQGSYINHLKTVHSVTTVSKPFTFKKFYIRRRKLLGDGSSKFLIMENFGKSFLVTACQQGGFINVSVALHGDPDECKNYSALVKLVGNRRIERTMFVGTVQPITPIFQNKYCIPISESEVRQRIITNPENQEKYWRISVSITEMKSTPLYQPEQPGLTVPAVNSTSSAGTLLSSSHMELRGSTSNQNSSTHLNRPVSEFARDFFAYSFFDVDRGQLDLSSNEYDDIFAALLSTAGISSPPLVNLNDTSSSPCP